MSESNVPCNGCTLCCQTDAIRLLPGDDPTLYETIPHEHFPGHVMLAHKDDGGCIYLGEYGCTIHDHKPLMCRRMDCRNIAKGIKKKDLKRYRIPLSVWNRGRQLSGRGW